jgi:hypothetical protein
MADMVRYPKVSFWLQFLGIAVGVCLGALVTAQMGAQWSFRHRFAVRIACIVVVTGVTSVLGIIGNYRAQI